MQQVPEYLLNAKQLRRDGQISKNSASGYWSTFRGFLKILYRNRMIKTNVNDFLEKIEPEDVAKEYLSVEELYCLAETPCKIPVLKTASLFSCLTSLRLSDILSLCWEEIVDFAAGGKMCPYHHPEDQDGRHHPDKRWSSGIDRVLS